MVLQVIAILFGVVITLISLSSLVNNTSKEINKEPENVDENSLD